MPQLHDNVWQNGLVVDKICCKEVLLAADKLAVLVQRPVPLAAYVCAALRTPCSFQKFTCSRHLFVYVPLVGLRFDLHEFPIKCLAPPNPAAREQALKLRKCFARLCCFCSAPALAGYIVRWLTGLRVLIATDRKASAPMCSKFSVCNCSDSLTT